MKTHICNFIPEAQCDRPQGDCEQCPRPKAIGWNNIKPGKWERVWMPKGEGARRIEQAQKALLHHVAMTGEKITLWKALIAEGEKRARETKET